MTVLGALAGALMGNEALFEISIDGAPGLTRVVRFSGHEALSSLFEFQVEVAGPELDLRGLLGKKARLKIDGIDAPRYVHGIISQVEQSGSTSRYTLYELTLVPGLWRLSQRVGCRVFQHETTEQVITAVLKDAGIKDGFRFELGASYAPRGYCVQYRESDLAFISRLLEEDGIFYFFQHDEGEAVLVMGDHAEANPPIVGAPLLSFNDQSGVRQQEHVTQLRRSEAIRPGKVSLRDFNFHAPDQAMEVCAQADCDVDLEVFDYPGEYQEPTEGGPHQGQSMAKIRLEALQAAKRQISGGSDCMRLAPGHTFRLISHPRADLNEPYLITRVVHSGSQPQALDQEGEGAFHYGNEFTCLARSTPFRPARTTARPVVRGIQSATVVGAGSEEVHTDAQGRVMVQFHWDRAGQMNEKSSCWVRVSQAWAGQGWGAIFLPRVGHEVLVDFIEGDPDRPIITGRVYHAKNDLPYPLPDEKTKSSIKSSSSPGGGGFNELRFEDRKGGEEVFIHAQRDLNEVVLNNNSRSVTANQSFSVGGNQSFTITKNRSVTVTEGDESLTVALGKSSTTVKKDRSVTVQEGDSSLTVEAGSHTATVKQAITASSTSSSVGLTAKTSMSLTAEDSFVAVEAKRDALTAKARLGVSIESTDDALSVQAKTGVLVSSSVGPVMVEAKEAALGIVAKEQAYLGSKVADVLVQAPKGVFVSGGAEVGVGAKKVVIGAEEEITLVVGGSVITLKSDGIVISAPKITSTAVAIHEISGALIKIN